MARVIVIGAGIAGMAAARGLCRLNIETLIIEQATEVGEVGSGISLWPNALKALARLGIDGPVRRLAIEEGSGGIRSWCGRLLFQLDLRELRRELGEVTVILHRAELLSVLGDLTAAADMRLGARCIGFQQNDRRVKALLSDGTRSKVIFCLALMVSIRLFVRSSSARPSRDMQVTSPGGASPNLNINGYCPVFPWVVAVSSARYRCSKLIGFTGLLPKIFPTEAIERAQMQGRSTCNFQPVAQTDPRTDRSDRRERHR